jgi:hypothetical protein
VWHARVQHPSARALRHLERLLRSAPATPRTRLACVAGATQRFHAVITALLATWLPRLACVAGAVASTTRRCGVGASGQMAVERTFRSCASESGRCLARVQVPGVVLVAVSAGVGARACACVHARGVCDAAPTVPEQYKMCLAVWVNPTLQCVSGFHQSSPAYMLKAKFAPAVLLALRADQWVAGRRLKASAMRTRAWLPHVAERLCKTTLPVSLGGTTVHPSTTSRLLQEHACAAWSLGHKHIRHITAPLGRSGGPGGACVHQSG